MGRRKTYNLFCYFCEQEPTETIYKKIVNLYGTREEIRICPVCKNDIFVLKSVRGKEEKIICKLKLHEHEYECEATEEIIEVKDIELLKKRENKSPPHKHSVNQGARPETNLLSHAPNRCEGLAN